MSDLGGDCRISVVVPVFNPGRRIGPLIASLEAQTMAADEFEVVFVDDGSTDGTEGLLDRLAATRRNVRVEHIPNSGWPGRPRNVGLGLAVGRYVAFVDHDDYLAVDGLRVVCDFADAQGSDVVVAREIGVGRRIGGFMFLRTVPDARLGRDPLVRLLTPHKVYRRALLEEHGIRFPEGKVRLEDHLFNLQVYFAASRVSILAEPYYYWTLDPDAPHASRGVLDPHAYIEVAVARILDEVDSHTEPGELRDRLASHWCDKKLLNFVGGQRFLDYEPANREEVVAAVRRTVLERFPPERDRYLTLSSRVRAHVLRTGDVPALLELAEIEAQVTSAVTTRSCRWDGTDIVVEYDVSPSRRDGVRMLFRRDGSDGLVWIPGDGVPGADAGEEVLDVVEEVASSPARLLFKFRDSPEEEYVDAAGFLAPVPLEGSDLVSLTARCRVRIPLGDLLGSPGHAGRVVDLSSELDVFGWRSVRRLPAPPGPPVREPYPDGPELARLYSTRLGNLSVELAPAAPVVSAKPARARQRGSWLRRRGPRPPTC